MNVMKIIRGMALSLVFALAMVAALIPQLAEPAYAADPVYDITFYHDSIYGEGEAGHLTGSSTNWEKPTWGNDTWVGSARLRPKVYYEAGNDHFTLKVNISRMNGAHQPGGNYVSGTVKYNGHTITFKNWGPFGCGSDWVDIRFERSVFTFNYNGGRNYNQNTDNITVDHYWYNANNFSIVDTYNGKNFDIENQPYWAAYMSDFTGYMFDGWWTEATGGTRITPEDITKHKQSMTLYAHWEQFWNVDLVGGSWTTPSRGTIDSYGHHETKVVRGQEMEPVIFTVNEGYHIDHNKIATNVSGGGFDEYTDNGVTVERISDTHYVASGTPTGPVTIYIPSGHKYGDWHTTTAATCTTAGAKERECKYDATIKETAEVPINPDAHDWGEWTQTKAPTCSAVGTKERVCKLDSSHKETSDVAIKPDAHSYKFKDFTWTGSEAEGYTAAVANYVCEYNSEHAAITVNATLSEEVIDPTCTEPGKTTYTATIATAVSPDGQEHSATKDAKPTEALNHSWKFDGITWTGNDTDGYTAATASYVCERDNTHTETVEAQLSDVVTDPTCTEAGKTTYTATVAVADSPDGQEHIASKDAKPTDPIEHKWKFNDFIWEGNPKDGFTSAKATYVCENDTNHETSVEAKLTDEVIDPTCTEPGTTTYTATVEATDSPNGAMVRQWKNAKPTEALKHNWELTGFTWTGSETDGYTAATASYVCERDNTHTETVEAQLSDVVTEPTCEESGKTTYTATVAAADSPDGKEQTASNYAKITEATGHKWGEPKYKWTTSNTSVTATRLCETDKTHIEAETVKTTAKVTKKPTTTAMGQTTYTASFKNPAFKTQTRTLPNIPKLPNAPSGKVTILNTIANSAKKTNDVIWDKSKVKNATNYEINWRAHGAGKWASKTVGNTVRGTTTGLSIKGLYEIRVRPKNETGTGAWSNTVYRYFHTTEKIKLTSKSKGAFTMSWKNNPQATSYQVMFTTNKNGSGAANNINTVGKGKTSFTKSGLKSGTTYYVQIREVKKVGTTSYIGNMSVPVAVKVK